VAPFIPPPTPDQIERPVEYAEEIDPDILVNLCTLWNGSPEEEVVEALISKECVQSCLNRCRTAELSAVQETLGKGILLLAPQVSGPSARELQRGRRAKGKGDT
jgi:hypothetical protein